VNPLRAIPQDHALLLQLAAIAGNEPAGGLFEIRWERPDEDDGSLFHSTDRPQSITETIQGLGQRANVRLGAAPRRHRHDDPGAVERCWVLHANRPVVAALGGWTTRPSIVLRNDAGRLTAIWSLRQPLTPGEALETSRALARALGASEPRTFLPAAGTLEHPNRTPITATRVDPTSYTADEVLAGALAVAA
jgi:hypothetical protein